MQEKIILLIKSVLCDEKINCELSQTEIDEILKIANQHQIIPIILEGLHRLGYREKIDDVWINKAINLLMRDEHQLYALKKIQEKFSSTKIDFALLKGSSVKKLYPVSSWRLMGDVDILINEENYDKIISAMSELEFIEKTETNHELIWIKKPYLMVELHKKLIPSYNDDYYSYYRNAWSKFIKSDYNENFFLMKPEDEYIYLFTHLTKHYRDGGIGIRHIVDMWIYLEKHNDMKMDYVFEELQKIKLLEFYHNIRDLIDVWFCGKPNTYITEHLTQRIIESGSYGIKEWCDKASAARAFAQADSVVQAKNKKYINLIFLPFDKMKKKYLILKKIPLLLPIMWVVRWLDAILFKRKNIKGYNKKISYINDETVQAYNDELELVGLSFNLKKDE